MKYILNNWSVISTADPYDAPEAVKTYLHGTRSEDNKTVKTSRIVKVNGKEITTKSGSIYVLGTISPEYLQWMKENNIQYNENQPIKIKRLDE